MLGLTFKENCADLRNSKVVDIISELRDFGVEVFVHDSEADPAETLHEYGIVLRRWEDLPRADAIVAAVAHKQYHALGLEEIGRKVVRNGCFIDVKAGFDGAAFARAGLAVWRL